MKFTLITLFPDEISSSISFGVLGRAIKNKVIELTIYLYEITQIINTNL